MIVSIMKHIGLTIVLLNLLACAANAAKAPARKNTNLMSWLRSMRSKRQDDQRVYSLIDAIPGQPETDYPIFFEVPSTAFSCEGKVGGYYADIEARCQVFRICANTAEDPKKGFGFLCPNGTLFNQQYFVCDWYTNVDCANSEKFYNLNEQIGNAMGTFSNNDLMNSAKEIMGFPGSKQPGAGGPNGFGGSTGGSNGNNPSGLPVKPGSGSQTGGGGANGFGPSSGGSGFGQNNGGGSRFPPSSTSGGGSGQSTRPAGTGGSGGFSGPGFGSGTGTPSGNAGGSGTGPNGGRPVFVNNLGQLSTDNNAGFDPKESFLLKPDSDSDFGLDIRGPEGGLDPISGIGNSYSFGFPQDGNAPIRGSADLSEPVDPADRFNNNNNGNKGDKEPYLPPFDDGQKKQIYTYPPDIQSNGAPFNPEHTGEYNQQLNAQSPKYPASQIYAPVATQSAGPQGGSAPSQFNGGPSQFGGSQRPGQQSQGGPSQFGGPQQPGQSQGFGGPVQQQSGGPQRPGQQNGGPSSFGGPQQPGQSQGFGGPAQQQSGGPQRPGQQNGGPSQFGGSQQPGQGFGGPSQQQSGGSQRPGQQSQGQGSPSQFGGQNQGFGGPSGGVQRPGQQSQGGPSQFGGPQRPGQSQGNGSPSPQYGAPQRPGQQNGGPSQRAPSGGSSFPSSGQSSGQAQPSRQYLQPAGGHQNGHNAPQQFQRPGQSSQNSGAQAPRPFSHQHQQQPQSYQSQSGGSQQAFAQPQGFQSQAPAQPFRAQNQQAERRQFKNPQQSHQAGGHQNHQAGGQQNQGSNESYLKKLFENKVHIHHDKKELVDFIQRIFVPEASQRVVSAEAFPSPARETYSFTYNEPAGASSNQNSIRHQHSGNCGHPGY